MGGAPLPGGGSVDGVKKRSCRGRGWFWGHCLYVGVTGPTDPARYVRFQRRTSDPNVWAVTRKAGPRGEPGSLLGQGVT